MQQDARASAMRLHQDTDSQGHGAQIRRCTESYLKDLRKLQEMLTDQGAVAAREHGLSEDTGGQKSRATASARRISSDGVQRLRSGEACDPRRPVTVGAGAGSRCSPSMTKLSIPARRLKQFATADLHRELAVRPPSPPSPATQGSATAVTARRNTAKPNPDEAADSTAERPSQQSHTATSPVDRARRERENLTAAGVRSGELESTTGANRGDHAQQLDGSGGWRSPQGAGAGADAIAHAAAALLMLSSDENSGLSPRPSSSSSSWWAGSPVSRTTAAAAERGDGDISRNSGGEGEGEDATAGSVLSRPAKKRRHRLVAELLAETPRLPREGP